MPFTTYAELQSTIGDFLNRDDLSATIPSFIALAEAALQRDVRHWRMEKRATATIDARFSAVPGDFLQPLRIHVDAAGKRRPLDLISVDDMQSRRFSADDVAGAPAAYAVVGGEFEFFPTPDQNYTAELYYVRTLDKLSDTNTSNWLLDVAPDAYLYASLAQTAPYLQEDGRLQTWRTLYQEIVRTLNLDGQRGKFGATGLKMSTRQGGAVRRVR